MNIYDRIYNTGLIPVIKIEDKEKAVPLAKALRDGGLNAAEITFRTDCAAEAISNIACAYPDMLIGAGTVLTVSQAELAVASGAAFIVSPGMNTEVVEYCLKKDIPVLPGCSSPTDIETALRLGLNKVKFFPAEALGGVGMLKAISAPYKVKFMPTGGISKDNLLSYLSLDSVIACGGSFMVSDKLVAESSFEEVTRLASESVRLLHSFGLKHIGINTENAEQAEKAGKMLSSMFGFPLVEIPVSYFAGPLEVMKYKDRGENGHIAIGCTNIDRAVYHLESRGISIDKNSYKYDENGKANFVYLSEDMCGFAFHLSVNR